MNFWSKNTNKDVNLILLWSAPWIFIIRSSSFQTSWCDGRGGCYWLSFHGRWDVIGWGVQCQLNYKMWSTGVSMNFGCIFVTFSHTITYVFHYFLDTRDWTEETREIFIKIILITIGKVVRCFGVILLLDGISQMCGSIGESELRWTARCLRYLFPGSSDTNHGRLL
jgi:hypothetical protein